MSETTFRLGFTSFSGWSFREWQRISLSCFFISILEPNLKVKRLPFGPTAETAPPMPSRSLRAAWRSAWGGRS